MIGYNSSQQSSFALWALGGRLYLSAVWQDQILASEILMGNGQRGNVSDESLASENSYCIACLWWYLCGNMTLIQVITDKENHHYTSRCSLYYLYLTLVWSSCFLMPNLTVSVFIGAWNHYMSWNCCPILINWPKNVGVFWYSLTDSGFLRPIAISKLEKLRNPIMIYCPIVFF